MTKTFKLIKTYPNSPAIGTEVIQTDEGYYLTNEGLSFTVNEVENFPFFWEEVVPFSFTTEDGVEITNPNETVFWYDSNGTELFTTAIKAKKNPSTETFSTLKALRYHKKLKIYSFSLNDIANVLSSIEWLDYYQQTEVYQAFYDYQYND